MSQTSGSSEPDQIREGFTLVELIISMAVLAILALLMSSMISRTSLLWRQTRDQVQTYQDARAAQDSIGSALRQAVLNPSLEYFQNNQPRSQANVNFVPDAYGRYSDLLFFVTNNSGGMIPSGRTHAVFFQAPLSYSTNSTNEVLSKLLNLTGFYVEYGSDSQFLPPLPALAGQAKNRYRLMQFLQPTDKFSVYSATNSSGQVDTAAVTSQISSGLQANSRILADNVIALILQPKASSADTNVITPNFSYDSRAGDLNTVTRHQLPPIVGVTMVAIDEQSASRLDSGGRLQSTIDGALAGKFQQTSQLVSDLEQLRAQLAAAGVGYRIFTTDVGIRAARWSER